MLAVTFGTYIRLENSLFTYTSTSRLFCCLGENAFIFDRDRTPGLSNVTNKSNLKKNLKEQA